MSPVLQFVLRVAAASVAFMTVRKVGVFFDLGTYEAWFLLGSWGGLAMVLTDAVSRGLINAYKESKK